TEGYCPKPAAPRAPRAIERVRTSNSAGCFRDVAESATTVRDQPAASTRSRASAAAAASWGCSPYGVAAIAVLPGVSVVSRVKKRSFVHAGPALMPRRPRSSWDDEAGTLSAWEMRLQAVLRQCRPLRGSPA